MNAIVFSAVWGVVMMFGGIFLKKKASAKWLAIVGIALLVIVNWHVGI